MSTVKTEAQIWPYGTLRWILRDGASLQVA